MAEQVIGYVSSLVVIVAAGIGLPRWFAWRRSLQSRLSVQSETPAMSDPRGVTAGASLHA
jgi:hypothetical protein